MTNRERLVKQYPNEAVHDSDFKPVIGETYHIRQADGTSPSVIWTAEMTALGLWYLRTWNGTYFNS